MKTSVIEVYDMLSALSVDGVKKRIGEVPGVESVTVNYAAGSATVRYDETRLDVDDIKAAMHQSKYQSAGESLPKHVSEHKPARKRAAVPTPEAADRGPLYVRLDLDRGCQRAVVETREDEWVRRFVIRGDTTGTFGTADSK